MRLLVLILLTAFLSNLNAQPYSIVEGNTAFALDFYKALSAQGPGNVFVSPFSLSCALAMTYPGARDTTAKEMKLTLGFLDDLQKQNSEYASLIRTLNAANSPVKITNTLWAQLGYAYDPAFTRINNTYFGSNFKQLDFRDSEAARNEINTAIATQTNDKIKDLIPPGSITSLTRLVLTNAIYFKDAWASPFKKELSRSGSFYSSSRETVTATFMQNSGHFPGFENDVVSIIELPYKNANYSMQILLPKVSMEEFEANHLYIENYASWNVQDMMYSKIQIPRFKVEQKTEPRPILESFGMKTAFTKDADFTGITNAEKLYISKILHKAFVEVNEEGAEAAAATAVVVATRSAQSPGVFVADRPFIFIIKDNRSKSILFIGRLVKPTV